MVAKDRSNTRESPNPKAEVGEIDTRAPFQSVKDAVSLFGEGAFSGERPSIRKPKPQSAEKVLAKETQLHLAEKELNKLKDKLKSAETTKIQALSELENVKSTVEDLKNKLKVLSESKESAIKATEAAKNQAKQLGDSNSKSVASGDDFWKIDLESSRAQYAAIITELDAAKQELRKIRQNREVSLEAQVTAFKQESSANDSAKANLERVGELSKEIAATKESVERVRVESAQAKEEQGKVFARKDVQRQTYKSTLEESVKRLELLKKELEPEVSRSLELKLAETLAEIKAIEKQTEVAKASDLDSVRTVTLELDDAKGSLQKFVEEEISLRSLVESLKSELESVKREHAELREKEAITESLAGNLHVKLRKSKAELEYHLSDQIHARNSCDEMMSTVTQLTLEKETAQKDAEEMKLKADQLKKETESIKLAAREAETKLKKALEKAEEARSAEERAKGRVKALSEETDAARTSVSEPGSRITISREELETISKKVESSERVAQMKVAAAEAHAEAVRASQNEVARRYDAVQREVEESKAAEDEAVRRAEMAEAAQRAVEGELRRWREKEQKKAAEAAAARFLAGNEAVLAPPETPPRHSQVYKLEKDEKKGKKEKEKLSKKTLLPNLSGIFNRKRSQIEGGSPSYLPGEKPI